MSALKDEFLKLEIRKKEGQIEILKAEVAELKERFKVTKQVGEGKK